MFTVTSQVQVSLQWSIKESQKLQRSILSCEDTSLYHSRLVLWYLLAIMFAGPGRLPSIQGFHVKSIYVYPIKSCAGFRVQSWPLSSTGSLSFSFFFINSVRAYAISFFGANQIISSHALIKLDLN